MLEGTGAKVTTPRKTAEIRLHRIEESVTAEEIVAAIAKKEGCEAKDVSTGPILMAHYGLCIVVARCPLEAVGRIIRRLHHGGLVGG